MRMRELHAESHFNSHKDFTLIDQTNSIVGFFVCSAGCEHGRRNLERWLCQCMGTYM
jgi:hypothetical protein